MSVEIMEDESILVWHLLFNELRDPIASAKAVIIKDYDPATNHSMPNPIDNVFRGLIDVDIYVTKTKRTIVDEMTSLIWEYSL